jgi:hypothetical protein
VFVDDAQHLRCVVGDDAGHWVLERPVAGLTCCPTKYGSVGLFAFGVDEVACAFYGFPSSFGLPLCRAFGSRLWVDWNV